MRVLVGCEFSGIVRDAFIELGHDAVSCDLLPTEREGPHIRDDVLKHLDDGWDLGIFHPDCSKLCNSGVLRLYIGGKAANGPDISRWEAMRQAAAFFRALLNCSIPKVAVENPVMHRHALALIGIRHTQTIQPWMFGEDASKRTCLWLRGLKPLEATNIIRKARYANQTPSGQNKLGPSPDRWMKRSRTYPRIAAAMAQQWGGQSC